MHLNLSSWRWRTWFSLASSCHYSLLVSRFRFYLRCLNRSIRALWLFSRLRLNIFENCSFRHDRWTDGPCACRLVKQTGSATKFCSFWSCRKNFDQFSVFATLSKKRFLVTLGCQTLLSIAHCLIAEQEAAHRIKTQIERHLVLVTLRDQTCKHLHNFTFSLAVTILQFSVSEQITCRLSRVENSLDSPVNVFWKLLNFGYQPHSFRVDAAFCGGLAEPICFKERQVLERWLDTNNVLALNLWHFDLRLRRANVDAEGAKFVDPFLVELYDRNKQVW